MAPSPIVPSEGTDDLPLRSALAVTVRPLVRVGGAVVLLADHTPSESLTYDWQATAGTVEELDRDLVLWRLPAEASREPQLAQVAIAGAELAVVASYRWGAQAA